MTAADIRCYAEFEQQKFKPIRYGVKKKTRLDQMRVFEESCYGHMPREKHKKLDDTEVKCYFLGYERNHEASQLLNADDKSIAIKTYDVFVVSLTQDVKKTIQTNFNIIEYEDKYRMTASSDQVDVEAPVAESFQTPQMRARQAPAHGDQERPSGAIPSRASRTPGRDGEEEWMVQPVRKKCRVT